MAVTRYFGARVKRREDPRLITGRGRYTHNIVLPGMVYISFVRSPHAHATIKKINTSRAEKSSGVLRVLTGSDLVDKVVSLPCAWQIPNSDLKVPRYMPLAVDKVRFVGDPVAAVVASSFEEAVDAAHLVEVEYQKLPAVTNPEEAVKDGAPQLYDDVPNNKAFTWKAGDSVDEIFAKADVVVSQRLLNSRLQPTPLETRAVVADFNATTQEATVYLTTQNPHVHRFLLSAVTGIPEHKLRVVSHDVGGGFGAKIHLYPPEIIALHVASELKRPVKWVETRSENFTATIHGRDHVQYVDVAADRDGRVLGLKVKSYANMGAYLSTAAPGIPTILFGPMLSGPYRIPSIYVEVVGALTNTAPVDAYRGAGRPEATYILERMIDILARKLGKDPAEIRLKNFIPKDQFPYSAKPIGLVYDSGDYEKAFLKALELARYQEWRNKQAELRKQGRLIGIGISSYIEICGLGPSSVARATGFGLGLWESTIIRVHPSGKVSVFIGGHPHGQGEETTFAQIVADRLQIPIEDVEILHGDTAMVPFGMGTYGSRTTPVAGGSLAIACDRVLEKARKIAAHLFEVSEKDVEYGDGKFFVRGLPEKSKSFAEVAYASYAAGANEIPQGLEPGLEVTVFFDPPNFTFPFGTHVCVTEVDRETGKVKILDYVAVDDCGNRINPMIVDGQIHGGIAQGLAQALYEEAFYNSEGQLLTGDLTEYLVPSALEVPFIRTDETVTPSPVNPLGVKGIGEAGTIASTPAVVNSVLDALAHLGVIHIDMPLKPEKIVESLKKPSS
ncbi:MAG: molybdopterin cofactor-binding domain-containing protein [Candidatus Caldarchaeum sp.]